MAAGCVQWHCNIISVCQVSEEPMKKEFTCCVFFPQRVVPLQPDNNVCVSLTDRLSSRWTCLLQSCSLQRIPAQSKVEGEHSKDTRLAAVLISWLTAQVIYSGWRFLQFPSGDRVFKKKKERKKIQAAPVSIWVTPCISKSNLQVSVWPSKDSV